MPEVSDDDALMFARMMRSFFSSKIRSERFSVVKKTVHVTSCLQITRQCPSVYHGYCTNGKLFNIYLH